MNDYLNLEVMKRQILILFIFISFLKVEAQPFDDFLLPVTTLLEFNDGSSGTGLIYSDKSFLYLVTANHVIINLIYNPTQDITEYHLKDTLIRITFYSRVPNESNRHEMYINLKGLFFSKGLAYNPQNDIAVLKIGKVDNTDYDKVIYNQYVIRTDRTSSIQSNSAYFKFKDIRIGNDIYMSGFPKSIGLKTDDSFDGSLPLMRKGIVAGKYDKYRTIIIDCASYAGNSGGPVLMMKDNHGALIGIVSKFIPYEEKWINPQFGIENKEWSNSGYTVVISFEHVIELIKTLN